MFWRVASGVVAAMVVAAVGSSESSMPPPQRTLDCETALEGGAVACVVTESFISPRRFPAGTRFSWPPNGYVLRDRALLVEPDDGAFCVVPIRTLQRERDALYGELIDQLPALHEGFAACEPSEILQAEDPDYQTIVRMLREVLPAPNVSLEPSGNTIVGMRTTIDWNMRPQPFVATRPVVLSRGVTTVTIDASLASYVNWTREGDTTGPHSTRVDSVNPTFVYLTPGDEQIHVIDVWTVRITADGVRPFHDLVHVVHAPVNVRVHELVISTRKAAGTS